MSKCLLYCLARSLRTFFYKHSIGVLISPKSLIASSKFKDSKTSDSICLSQTIILAAIGVDLSEILREWEKIGERMLFKQEFSNAKKIENFEKKFFSPQKFLMTFFIHRHIFFKN